MKSEKRERKKDRKVSKYPMSGRGLLTVSDKLAERRWLGKLKKLKRK